MKTQFLPILALFLVLISCNEDDCPPGFGGPNCSQIDLENIQELLDTETYSPLELVNLGIYPSQLYGMFYQGGIIFYIDVEDTIPAVEGLIAAPQDQTDRLVNWGCMWEDIVSLNNVRPGIPGDSIPLIEGGRIGDGKTNTDAILLECSEEQIAAELCRNLGEEWFLPSYAELNEMYLNLFQHFKGGFSNQFYWTSTERSDAMVMQQNFANSSRFLNTKNSQGLVRAAKAF